MANKFSKSIGYTGSITGSSINLNQREGSAAKGYAAPKPTMKGAAKDRISPDAGCGANGPGAADSSGSIGAGGGKYRP